MSNFKNFNHITSHNNANTSAQRNIYEESVFYDDFEPRKYTNNENETTTTEYLILNGKRQNE